MGHGHYILNGRDVVPVEMMVWARWLEDNRGQRIVGFWKFKSCNVSTVFLGLDHGWMDAAPPVVFETLVFGGPMDGDGERYSTYDEAEQGHLHYCELVRDMERTMHWRKAKRWRNKLAKERRRFNNRKIRRRQLELMQAYVTKLSSNLKEKEDGEK